MTARSILATDDNFDRTFMLQVEEGLAETTFRLSAAFSGFPAPSAARSHTNAPVVVDAILRPHSSDTMALDIGPGSCTYL